MMKKNELRPPPMAAGGERKKTKLENSQIVAQLQLGTTMGAGSGSCNLLLDQSGSIIDILSKSLEGTKIGGGWTGGL